MATQSNEKNRKPPKTRQIVFPPKEAEYPKFIDNQSFAREQVDLYLGLHPELFPPAAVRGYVYNGTAQPSSKQGIRLRQIRAGGETYRVRPSFVLPYLQARTDKVWKATLRLR